MSDELKPCPFCGGECDATGWLRGDGVRGPECAGCGATAASAEDWNRRAQPAEAEGSDVVAWAHPDYCDVITDSPIRTIEWEHLGLSPVPLVRQSDHLAALSAVTAERDRVQKDAARWNWYAPRVAAQVGESLVQMNATVDAAMAAKEA